MGLATIQNQYLDGQMGLTCAQDTAAEVDDEIHAVLMHCFGEAVQILEDNRTLLDEIAGYLLIKETITGAEMMSLFTMNLLQQSLHRRHSPTTQQQKILLPSLPAKCAAARTPHRQRCRRSRPPTAHRRQRRPPPPRSLLPG